jgi:hypothetical protein
LKLVKQGEKTSPPLSGKLTYYISYQHYAGESLKKQVLYKWHEKLPMQNIKNRIRNIYFFNGNNKTRIFMKGEV